MKKTVYVALLFSVTGWMSKTEKALLAMGRFCFANLASKFQERGIELQVLWEDCKSDENTIRQNIRTFEALGCLYFFGPYTTLHRTAAQSAMRFHSLLFYPVQYEGFDDHSRTFFFGGTPAQQLLPALDWFLSKEAEVRTVSFVGSNYHYPEMVDAFLREPFVNRGLESLRSSFIPIKDGQDQLTPIGDFVEHCCSKRPGLIINAINGNANQLLFEAIYQKKQAGSWPLNSRVVSLSVSDVELLQYKDTAQWGSHGTYIAANCFDHLFEETNGASGDLIARRKHFIDWLKSSGDGFSGLPPMLSDAMVNLSSAIDVWSKYYLLHPQTATSTFRSIETEIDGPKGSLKFSGGEQHGEKRFFIGFIENGKVTKVDEPVAQPLSAEPRLQMDLPTDSVIYELVDRKKAESLDPDPLNFSGSFGTMINDNSLYQKGLGHCFSDFYGISVHDLSQIIEAVFGRLGDPEHCGLVNSRLKTQWWGHWQPVYKAIKELRCTDEDITFTLSLWENEQRFKALDLETIAFATCKLRAIYYRHLPPLDKPRLYLFDLLHIALRNDATLQMGGNRLNKNDDIPLFNALSKNRKLLEANCWYIPDKAAAKILPLFHFNKCEHAVSVEETHIRYTVTLETDSKRFPDYSEWSLVLARPESNHDLEKFVFGLRLLDKNLAITYPPPGKFNDKFKGIDRFYASAPVCVVQIQSESGRAASGENFKAQLTAVFKGGL